MLLLLTGARRSEVTQAKWEHVERKSMPCWCRRRIRQIALNAATIALLRSVPRDPATPYLFRTRLTGLFYPWNRIGRRAGPPDVRPHDLRHSFASFLVNSGMSLYVVQDLLGHTQPRTIERYAHQTLSDAAEVVSGVVCGPQACAEITSAERAPLRASGDSDMIREGPHALAVMFFIKLEVMMRNIVLLPFHV